MLEEESMTLRTELYSAREEVRHLRAELSKETVGWWSSGKIIASSCLIMI